MLPECTNVLWFDLVKGQDSPSDSALAAARGSRPLAAQPRTGPQRAALLGACARASAPRRYTPSEESHLLARNGRHQGYIHGGA